MPPANKPDQIAVPTNDVNPTSPTPLIPPVTPPQKPKKNPLLIIIVIILMLVIAGIVAVALMRTLNPPAKESPSPTPTPQNTVPTTKPTPSVNTYKNLELDFSFTYPLDWQVTEEVVPKGTTKQETDKYDINAKEGDVSIISVTNSDWELRLLAQKDFVKESCGGFGPVSELNQYTTLQVLNRQAARHKLEEGFFWQAPDAPDPHPQPVFFKRLPDELTDSWPSPDTPESLVYKWCYEDNTPLRLTITYHSPSFTTENFTNKKVDTAVIGVMDEIVSSIKTLSSDTGGVPKNWIKHDFPEQNLTLYSPPDYKASATKYITTNSTLLKFWPGTDPDAAPALLDIKPDWSNTGNAKDLERNYTVAGTYPATKVDPPAKSPDITSYQTNYYFEVDTKVYVFQCHHNWDEDILDTCETILNSIAL